jgi:hypothetical protein
MISISRYISENSSQLFSISFSFKAGMPFFPMKSITRTLDFTSNGAGQGIIP